MLTYWPIAVFACLMGIQVQLFLIHKRLVRTERRVIVSKQYLIELGGGKIPEARKPGHRSKMPTNY